MTETLEGYKEEVSARMRGRLVWNRDLFFTAETHRGYDIDFDAAAQLGCMPMESLLLSLAGCLAIDAVAILTKMRCTIQSCRMAIEAERSTTPPQRLLSVELVLHLSGEGLSERKVQRALSLSEKSYCSVRHSLRDDIPVVTRFVIE